MSLDSYSDEELKEELARRLGITISSSLFSTHTHKRYAGPHKFPTFQELGSSWGPYNGGPYCCKDCGEVASTWSPGLESNTSDCPGATLKEKLLELQPELHETLKHIPGFKRVSVGTGWLNIHYVFVSTKYSFPRQFKGCTVQLRGDS